jgi:hypothetical protein
MHDADQYIIDTINNNKANNTASFSFYIQLEKEQAKSKALLIDRIKHIQENIFTAHGVECWSIKHFYSYIDKEKTTYFHAILFCKFKRI